MAILRNPAKWRKAQKRRRKAFAKKVDKSNAEYDKVHGGARIITLTPEEDR